jgi:hypothetical protein
LHKGVSVDLNGSINLFPRTTAGEPRVTVLNYDATRLKGIIMESGLLGKSVNAPKFLGVPEK